MPPLTVDQAIHVLHMHKHQVHGVGKRPGLRPRVASPEAVDAALKKGVGQTDSWMRREASRKSKGAVTE